MQPQQVAVAEAAEAEPLAGDRHRRRRGRCGRCGPPRPRVAAPSRRSWRRATAGPPASWGKVPRNAPCPCGSGKKYKHCHGRLHCAAGLGGIAVRRAPPDLDPAGHGSARPARVRFFRAAPAALVGLGIGLGARARRRGPSRRRHGRGARHRGRRSGRRPPTTSSAASTRRWTQGAELIVLRMDTPGGLADSMRVDHPGDPRLAGAGGGLRRRRAARARRAPAPTSSTPATIAAMAPGTNLGAATPVQIGGGGFPGRQSGPPPTRSRTTASGDEGSEPEADRPSATAKAGMEDKILNDAVAYIRCLAQLRGRNVEWAEKAVREAASLSGARGARAGRDRSDGARPRRPAGRARRPHGRGRRAASARSRPRTRGGRRSSRTGAPSCWRSSPIPTSPTS